MPRFSDEFIEEVRSQNNIVSVISGYVTLTKRGSNYFGLCPFHGEKTASFSVSEQKQMYYCFGCGAGGNVITFLMEFEHFTFQEAVENLAQRAGIPVPQQESTYEEKRAQDRRSAIYTLNKEAANYFYLQRKGPRGEAAQRYLAGRGLSEETIRAFALGFSLPYRDDLYRYLKQKGYQDDLLRDSGLIRYENDGGGSDRFWNRVMFPIQDVTGHVIGFGGRVLGDGLPKYVNSPETDVFDKSRNLYALHLARRSREDAFLLCEGYMDVISLHQAGFTNAVASLGTSLTAGHAKLLARYKKEVLLCYDSDAAGIKAALRAIPILKQENITARVLSFAPYKDPDECIGAEGAEAFRERMRQAQDGFLFTMDQLQKEYDMNDPLQKTRFQQAAAQQLSRIEDEFERTNYLEECAARYGIPADSLRSRVNRLGLEGGLIPQDFKSSRSPVQQAPQGTDGIATAQRILLTCLCETPEMFEAVRTYVSPEDYEGTLFREAAQELYAQLEHGRPDPAAILDRYPDEADQKEIAAMFQAGVMQEMDEAQRRKTLIEAIRKVKQRSIEQMREESLQDPEAVIRMIEEKQALEKLIRKGEL